MGGDVDGMGDLDNAPMPPMGSDMPMDDAMGGQDPNAMPPIDGQDPNEMGGEQSPMDAPQSEDDAELSNVIDSLSMEDKAAVLKYAKSMADNSNGGEQEAPMPMEAKKSMKDIIDETIQDVLNNDGKKGTKRDEKRIPKEYEGMKSPFKSPY